MSEPEELLVERRESTVWLTLSRPEALNAMNAKLLDLLAAALDMIEGDPDVRCVILTGAGRAFCAGADLKFVNDLPDEDRDAAVAAFLTRATRLMARLEALRMPVIAAVNGIATAGGMELLLCCDLVIAADNAKLGDGHANFGLLPGAGASIRLPRRIGATRAKYLFFTGDLVAARDPLLAGLINDVVPASELLAAAEQLANRIALKSPLGLRRMKELANEALDMTLEQGLRLELAVNASYSASIDRQEGLTAFNEGRSPVFIGK